MENEIRHNVEATRECKRMQFVYASSFIQQIHLVVVKFCAKIKLINFNFHPFKR